ncbi:hypothetical protein [Spirochaeta cellobiosiphila]|uniref:hypothetical protein n=1 Tax=Spirochaeta cellobiosiphila TaxID=504483 RepID=UPI0004181A87|nr:hypothetical protein [Spirochaeta cellobiosiphila]
MNKLQIENINEDRVKIQVEDIDSGLRLIFEGDIDMQDPSQILDPLFDKIHTGACEQGFDYIEVDFNKLSFLNSSGIKALAKWIMKMALLSEHNKYLIKIIHNKSITWQVTSLPTLTYLVPGAVTVE